MRFNATYHDQKMMARYNARIAAPALDEATFIAAFIAARKAGADIATATAAAEAACRA